MANYTLNYTGEKVDELLNKIDTAFGESTVMGDTLTWDGDMTGRVYAEMEFPIDEDGNTTTMYIVHVSDAIPTYEDLESGGNIGAMGQTVPFPYDEEVESSVDPTDIGSAIMISNYVFIAKEDNADLTNMLGIILPKKGVYFVSMPAMGINVESFTINGYTEFESKVVKTIDPKYLPSSGGGLAFVDIIGADLSTLSFDNATANKTYAEIKVMISIGAFVVARINSANGCAYAPILKTDARESTVSFKCDYGALSVMVTIAEDNSITSTNI